MEKRKPIQKSKKENLEGTHRLLLLAMKQCSGQMSSFILAEFKKCLNRNQTYSIFIVMLFFMKTYSLQPKGCLDPMYTFKKNVLDF